MKNHLLQRLCKVILPVVFGVCLTTSTFSQHFILGNEKIKIEAGLNFGPTFFLGDLGGKHGKGTTFIKDINPELTKLMKGGFVTFYPNNWVGLRVAGQYTYVEGQDYIINTNGVDELWRKQRNLDFKSNMWEIYTAVEFFPIMFFKRKDEEYLPKLRPYGFAGIGLFHFNPKGSLVDQNGNRTWHELQPLSTEGQGFPEYRDKKTYKLTQVNIPLGGGVKYFVSDRVNLGFELIYRKTFTDYIDDVSTTYIDPIYFDAHLDPASAAIARRIHDKTFGIVTPGVTRYDPGVQRGNPRNMDAYFSFVLKMGVKLGDVYESMFDRNSAKKVRCPRF
ncbi:MAG: hypothetical protein ACOYKE_04785 [Ferruginibacter sp.]